VLNKGVNLSVLYNHVLERVAHITCPSTVSTSYGREGGGGGGLREGGYGIRTALVEGVTRTVSEGIRTRRQRDPSKYAEPLYPL
jgi:hypothetical protein